VQSAAITGNVLKNGTCYRFTGVNCTNATSIANLTITGNTIDAGTTTNTARGFYANKTCSNVTITGNTFTSLSAASSYYAVMFDATEAVSGITITGNAIKSAASAGFAGLICYPPITKSLFTGNSVDGVASTFSSGVELYNTVTGLTVSGNQFSNLNYATVRLSASTAVTMADIKLAGNAYNNVTHRIRDVTSGGAVVASSVVSTDEQVPGVTSTATAAGTTTLTRDSTEVQVFTGTTTQTCVLPTTYIRAGHTFTIINASTGVVTVNASDGSTEATISASSALVVSALQATPTTATHWSNITQSKSDLGLGNVDNTSDATKNAATATLTNKTITSPRINELLDTNGATSVVINATASAANHLTVRNRAAGSTPQIETTGSDADIGLALLSKGSSQIFLSSGNGGGLQVGCAASGVNFYRITGGAAGTGPTLLASGTDTNVDMLLTTRGAGIVRANANPVGVRVSVPATSTSTGVVGQFSADSSWFYICTATNTWVRAALATW